ncbi:MAG TPA: hypothetical protein LFW11_05890 [Rickettsia endosymbiont of Proechinophthirus fluctus]|uniref:hypothetical protein n=1 Tax=Rickettsia endosymbiont of Proechinophthirus fluctus TaxID=1462733 RepID=UPI000AEBA202|nr:hypothetical protein [Rickettsia endosymbiont of Proechinophthirus fluctus]HJD54842.1 hypothetical protein [Rickettsia endosymbiont of Proechinophthirus fluctus]
MVLYFSFLKIYALSIDTNKQQAILECEGTADKKTLINAWYVNEPYQYLIAASNGHTTVSGMDIELMNAIAAKIGINIEYNQDNWYQVRYSKRQYRHDSSSYLYY